MIYSMSLSSFFRWNRDKKIMWMDNRSKGENAASAMTTFIIHVL